MDDVRPYRLKIHGIRPDVTPHEVAHQWFGHAVSWASYHDQWLSEGFAELRRIVSAASGRAKVQKLFDSGSASAWRILEKKCFWRFHRMTPVRRGWDSGSFLRAPGSVIRE